MIHNLENKKILVLGGAGRIGKAVSISIFESGGIPLIFDIDFNLLKKIYSNFKSDKLYLFKGDISNIESIKMIIKDASNISQKIDGAVYCAYPKSNGWGNNIENLNENNLKEDLYMQLGAPILFAKEILKYFSKNGGGNLINLSSIQGICAPKFEHYKDTDMTSPIEYSAMKSGIILITKWLAKYYKNRNIRINCVSPGGILDCQDEIFIEKYRESCTNKGLLDAKDIASTVNFLLSDYSYAINGQNIVIDDGWSL